MIVKKNYIKKIIKEEIKRILEISTEKEPEENRIFHLSYILLGKVREKFEEYLGEIPEGEEPSPELEELHDKISQIWKTLDKMLTGGETHDSLPELFENNSDCTQEEISNALDVVSRCVMSGVSQRPRSTETDLGVMPKRVSAPPAGARSGGVKWVDEGKTK